MLEVLEQLLQEFNGRVAVEASFPDQLYAAIDIADVPGIAAALRDRHAARLVTVFAEDRVEPEGCFYNYYVWERRGDACYLILRARIPAGDARFPSLAPGPAGGQLAGARDSGLVRHRSRRASQSAARGAAR